MSIAYQNVGKKVFCPTSWTNKFDLIYIPGDNYWDIYRVILISCYKYFYCIKFIFNILFNAIVLRLLLIYLVL